MSHIFISYASEDRPWVEPFAKTLEKQGWSVWWDRHIPTGHTYDDVIWSALQAASCVVVVWSTHSIGSEWVKEEASEAKRRHILLPVRIDEARPPFGFSRRQTQSLVGWRDGVPHRGYDQLLVDIARVLKAPPPLLSAKAPARRARLFGYLWLILPTLLVLMVVLGLMAWRIPTRVQIDLTVDRVEFTVGEVDGGWKNLLGALDFESLTIRNFSRARLVPHSISVADPQQYDFEKDTYPASAWRPVTLAQPSVHLTAGDAARHPAVTIRGEAGSEQGGRLDAVALATGSSVVLERAGGSGASLTMSIRAERPGIRLTPTTVFEAATQHTRLEGVVDRSPAESEGLTYRVSLKTSQPTVEVEGDEGALAMTIRPLGGSGDLFKGDEALAVTALDLFKQGSTGGRVSGLTEGREGVMRYPEFPDLAAVRFSHPDVVAIEELDRFAIKEVEWSSKAPGIRLVLDGVAGRLATRSGDFSRDHRLTQFDRLWHNPRLMSLLAILGWVVPTLIGARKLFKEQ